MLRRGKQRMEMTRTDMNEEGKERSAINLYTSHYDFRIVMEPYYFSLPLSMSPLSPMSACKQHRQTGKSIDGAETDAR